MSENLATYYSALTAGEIDAFWQLDDGRVFPQILPLMVNRIHLVPGSFRPLHAGHREIYDSIRPDGKALAPGEEYRGESCWVNTGSNKKRELKSFELSLVRRDKEFLGQEELAHRLTQFVGYAPVLVTLAGKMHQKAGLFPGSEVHFHVGYDTAARVLADEGKLGVQGIQGLFRVYRRAGQDLVDLPAFPSNFYRGVQLSAEIEYLSSTQLREAAPKDCGCFALHTCGASP